MSTLRGRPVRAWTALGAATLLASAIAGCPPAEQTVLGVGCSDGILEGDEACDDGNLWGGDGCTPSCTVEQGVPEVEPNDAAEKAQEAQAGGLYHGRITEGDRDCFALEVPFNAAIGARLEPDLDGGSCPESAVIELWRDEGLRIATSPPGPDDRCAHMDPVVDNRPRYLDEGIHIVCVSGLFGGAVRGYNLRIEVYDSCDDLPPLAADPETDLDDDGLADICDLDDDGDGVDDPDDNCPTLPNGPNPVLPWDTSNQGLVQSWLILGPFTTGTTPGRCEPSPDDFTGLSDADAAPALGDTVGGLTWFTDLRWPEESATFWFTDYFSVGAPRENYAFVWVNSPDARDATLAIGADDGYTLWLNGGVEQVIDSCQGVNADQFTVDVTLNQGWNRLLIKVYDQGGGWGLVLRFRDLAGAPMTDLGLSIGGPAPFANDQGDIDGDGIGDVCDPDPANP
jgi:cysteine-rich repeat protein